MAIPFMNLKRQNEALKQEFIDAMDRVIMHGGFILGPEVKQFEEAFASFHGVGYCLGLSSGTTALHITLHACGIGPGDEVIVPVNTFIATAEAVVHCGARPVFVDITAETGLIDPSTLEQALTPNTRAIIPVHLYGAPAPMGEICRFAEKHALTVIEDAAQAHGAELNGRRVGGFGKAAAFSFYPGKNLGALGDGGAVVTNDPELYEKMRLLRDHGAPRKYYHDIVGFNYRMDTITGAVLGIKLRHLERWTEARRSTARLYREFLADTPIGLPVEPMDSRCVYHLFVVRTRERDKLIEFLNDQGIGTNIHYPVPLHLQKAFAGLGYAPGSFPAAEDVASRIVSLPMCADITPEEVETVCSAVRKFLSVNGI